jgi:hypothetical protein
LSIRFQADNELKRIIIDATRHRERHVDFQTGQAPRLEKLHGPADDRQPRAGQLRDSSAVTTLEHYMKSAVESLDRLLKKEPADSAQPAN